MASTAGPTVRARLRAVPGYSFVELLVVSAILLILASAVLPLSKVTIQRQRSAESISTPNIINLELF